MTTADQFKEFVGKRFYSVVDSLRNACIKHGVTLNLLDESFEKNIDVEAGRLNVRLDGNGTIVEVYIG